MTNRKTKLFTLNEVLTVPIIDVEKGCVEVSHSRLGLKFPAFKVVNHIVPLRVLYDLVKTFGFNFQFGKLDYWSKLSDVGGQLIVIGPTGTDEFQFEIQLNWWEFRDALFYFVG